MTTTGSVDWRRGVPANSTTRNRETASAVSAGSARLPAIVILPVKRPVSGISRTSAESRVQTLRLSFPPFTGGHVSGRAIHSSVSLLAGASKLCTLIRSFRKANKKLQSAHLKQIKQLLNISNHAATNLCRKDAQACDRLWSFYARKVHLGEPGSTAKCS
jgi:hypothetical protein